MQYANNEKGERVEATISKDRGTCPGCKSEVVAKVGSINVAHWSHLNRADCDEWRENEGKWHREWKNILPPECHEVMIVKNGKKHFADLQTPWGLVIELQHSPISCETILAREKHYLTMVWLVDVREVASSGRFVITDKGSHLNFRWKHSKRSYLACDAPVWLDLGDDKIFEVRKIYPGSRTNGWGYIRSKQYFIDAVTAEPHKLAANDFGF